jgi:hypothetical protein
MRFIQILYIYYLYLSTSKSESLERLTAWVKTTAACGIPRQKVLVCRSLLLERLLEVVWDWHNLLLSYYEFPTGQFAFRPSRRLRGDPVPLIEHQFGPKLIAD